MDKYCLPDNYKHRLNNSFFDDTPFKDEYQDEVYKLAHNWAKMKGYEFILDIGTGSGYKLIKYFKEYETFGVDIEPTVTFLNTKYPDKNWGTMDDISSEYDMIICSDVIEHIPEPNEFIKSLLGINFDTIIFSTPDRDSLYKNTLGEPSNPAHVREWNMNEFSLYIGKYLDVLSQQKINNTQILVCQKK